MRRRARLVWSALILTLSASFLAGARPLAADGARAILDRRKALEHGERSWKDRHQHLRMRISGASGTRERELDVYEQRLPNDRQKAIVFLRGPADVRNVAFLAFSGHGKAADQWLYTPALKRVRQITASTRNEPFVSSDLTFHDLDLLSEMPSWSETDAISSLRGDERVADTDCHAIELRPQRDDIAYRRIVLWLGRDDLVPRQIDFHVDEPTTGWLGFGGSVTDSKPTKRIQQSSVSLDGTIPVARRIDVETPAKGSSTAIDIIAVEHDLGLPESLFTQHALEEGPAAAQR